MPKGRSVSLVADKPQVDGALYKFPAFGLLALGVAATALGNTRGTLNAFADLAGVKKNQGSAKTLSERVNIQAEMAKMTAAFRAARAYLHDEIEQTWEVAQNSDDIPVERRAALRMACTQMVRTGADIAHLPGPLRGTLEEAGLGVETMNSPAACRTFNILLSEGRRVAAALLPV